MLHQLQIKKYKALSGSAQDIQLSYQVFGKALHTAPIILVNHALTGNSNVTGESSISFATAVCTNSVVAS